MLRNYFNHSAINQTEESIYRDIKYSINRLWHSMRGHKTIVDDESQWKLIESMRRKYPFPDYLSLVGAPSPEDYVEPGKLSLSRKAELLLIGAFEWQGLTIGTHQARFGRDRFETLGSGLSFCVLLYLRHTLGT